ncbi:MAG TPA: hypothetical protein VH397_00645 [Xanthobacteraceae bacterium]|jgi:hypothetical protein
MMLRPCKPRRGPYRRRTEKRIVITDRKSIANIHELARRTDLTMDAAIDMACDERLARIEREMRRRVEWSRQSRALTPRPRRV